jgi:hypothetical protein
MFEKIVLLTRAETVPWRRYLPQVYGLSGLTIQIQRFLSLDENSGNHHHTNMFISFSLLLILFILSIQYLCYLLYNQQRKQPLILCSENKFNISVQRSLESEVGNYHPPWWYNRHLVSIMQFGQIFPLDCTEEIFTHEDGSHFKVKWYPSKPSESEEDFRLCVFVPGLGSLSTDVSERNFSLPLSSSSLSTLPSALPCSSASRIM